MKTITKFSNVIGYHQPDSLYTRTEWSPIRSVIIRVINEIKIDQNYDEIFRKKQTNNNKEKKINS